MIRFALFSTFSLLLNISVAADHRKDQIKPSAGSFATHNETPWLPQPFVQVGGRLPAYYAGMDAKKFLELFEAKLSNLHKGEYETSIEYSQRTSNIAELLSPISATDLYAFRSDYIYFKYNADAQQYLTSFALEKFLCNQTDPIGKFKGWVTCKISNIFRKSDTYIGSNAYGVSVSIERKYKLDFSFAMPDDGRLRGYFKQLHFPVPIEKAKSLKDLNIAVLFIARVAGAAIIDGAESRIKPTIHNPEDFVGQEKAIYFDIKRMLFYVVETGEILYEQLIPEQTISGSTTQNASTNDKAVLGISFTNITDIISKELNRENIKGVIVISVASGSVAEKAGIKIGDAIFEYDGKSILEKKDVQEAVAKTAIGDVALIKVLRDSQELLLKANFSAQ